MRPENAKSSAVLFSGSLKFGKFPYFCLAGWYETIKLGKIMATKINKTNAVRLLDRAKIGYCLLPYEVDEKNLAATHVAEQLGEDVERVFKTLVLRGDRNGFLVCVIPGNAEVDLKRAAKVSGNKSVGMIPVKELLPVTGYIRGGCSPVGMKRLFPTYIHSTCLDFEYIYISAGIRGLQIKMAPEDLVEYIGAEVCDLVCRTEEVSEG